MQNYEPARRLRKMGRAIAREPGGRRKSITAKRRLSLVKAFDRSYPSATLNAFASSREQ